MIKACIIFLDGSERSLRIADAKDPPLWVTYENQKTRVVTAAQYSHTTERHVAVYREAAMEPSFANGRSTEK